MTLADDYFARVRPLLGEGLSKLVLEVDGAEAALVVELLASCMLEHVVGGGGIGGGGIGGGDLGGGGIGGGVFAAQHAWKRPFAALRTTPARPDMRLVARRGTPAVVVDGATITMTVDPDDVLAYVDVSYHVARTIRDRYLAARTARDVDAHGVDAHGVDARDVDARDVDARDVDACDFTVRDVAARALPCQPFDPRGISTAHMRDVHVMVIGCGSLGSEAVRMLAPARFTLIDDARVTVYNLARQWFGASDVGRTKVDALRERVGGRAWCTRLEAADLPALEALVRDDPPDVVLLATGTHHHAMLGELFWRLGIPHVAACCYPRARYFEVSIVSPRERTPCLHCFRGHHLTGTLYRGPAEPIPDEVAAFLYEPVSDAVRAQRYTDLVAEPASQIETMRAAHVLARCAVEITAPVRTPWFTRVLAESTTCLLGGNAAGAYGITRPGQVLRLGTADIAGTSDHVRCDVCHRVMDVALREDPPAVDAFDDEADAAFL